MRRPVIRVWQVIVVKGSKHQLLQSGSSKEFRTPCTIWCKHPGFERETQQSLIYHSIHFFSRHCLRTKSGFKSLVRISKNQPISSNFPLLKGWESVYLMFSFKENIQMTCPPISVKSLSFSSPTRLSMDLEKFHHKN